MINDMNITTDIAAIEPMDDTELQGIVSAELEDAVSYIDSDVSPIRAKGTEYYRGDPFGNEEDGRSQVVAMEVRDTVSAMLPSLMKVFFSTENVVEYMPRGPEDVAGAQQATDYANYLHRRQQRFHDHLCPVQGQLGAQVWHRQVLVGRGRRGQD